MSETCNGGVEHGLRVSPAAASGEYGTETQWSCEVQIASGPTGDILVLRLGGEIDRTTLGALDAAVTAAFDRHPHDLVLDLAGVSFCCVRGYAVLSASARTAEIAQMGFAVSGLRRHMRRVMTLLWPERSFPSYRTAAAAVVAIRAEQIGRPA